MPVNLKYVPIALVLVLIAGGTTAYYFFSQTKSPYILAQVKRGNIVQEVLASGNVAAPSTIELQFQSAGRLSYLGVESGDKVQAGDVLARQDTSILDAQLMQARAEVDAQRANLDQLEQGTRPEQLAVTQAQVMNDQSALAQVDQAIVNAIRTAYTQSDDAVHNKIDLFINSARSANPQLAFAANDSSAASNLLTERTTIEAMLTAWQTSSAALGSDSDLMSAAADAQVKLSSVAKLLSDANTVLNGAISNEQASQTTINSWISSVSTARANVNTAITNLTTSVTAQQSTVSSLAKDLKSLELEKAGSTQSVIDAQVAAVAGAQAKASSLLAEISQKKIAAPINGTITKVSGHVGETIVPSTIVVTMIPDSKLQVDVNLSEDNVANVKVAESVRITLDAFPDRSWQGTVTKVDPAQTVIGGAVYYKTTVGFNMPDDRIKTGMTANVWIETGAAQNTLIIPASAITRTGANATVMIYQGGSIIHQPVSTGLTDENGMVEILSGLQDGERVVTGTK